MRGGGALMVEHLYARGLACTSASDGELGVFISVHYIPGYNEVADTAELAVAFSCNFAAASVAAAATTDADTQCTCCHGSQVC
jgi:hypothetical protein